MIRIISILTGLFFTVALLWSLALDSIQLSKDGLPHTAAHAFGEHKLKPLKLASDGAFGKFDKAQLQRGFAVYQNVCSACHSIKQVSYRSLTALGYNEVEVKAIAAAATINAKDPLTGEMKDRPGLPADKFPPVLYAGTGTPPDLSLITKARHGGAAYVYSLLTGYKDSQPAKLVEHFPDAKTPEGMFYNPYFANLNIAMTPPLTADGQVTYSDGTPATVDQMAKDVSAFLVWTAEPELEKRHQTGVWWLGFLLFVTVLAYMSYRNVWAEKKGH
ncbi:MAG: cytochrome c1 [Novosphingobium sp.]|uniref:cytochrome c1 n=1 Tax=Novosphingobium sp. TaxID=1874826 RepID=UPI001D52B328|nr:cytochrome c1 [Novosphingobium sp.]MCB2058519.1 cytochrome c1 [Novosphingobium sp.]MCP5387237.1 cytochrome c1 [Novosphingobium sp.]